MSVSPATVREYLGTRPDDWDWVKGLSDGELDAEITELGADPETLWTHQKQVVVICGQLPHFALWMDMGTGKTRTAMTVCRIHDCERVLVLVPYRVQLDSWAAEIDRFPMPVQFDVMTFAACRNRCKAAKGRVDKGRAREFGAQYQATIVDESSLIGNPTSLIYRTVIAVSERHRVRLALSGTPFGRDPMLLWSQMRFVDRGASLGDYWVFREAFFYSRKRPWGRSWEFRENMTTDLNRKVGHRSIRYRIDECMSLPRRTRQRLEFDLPNQAAEVLADLRGGLATIQQTGRTKQIESHFMRVLQANSGFLYDADGVIDLGQQARFEPVIETILQTDEPIIVFRTFRATETAFLGACEAKAVSCTINPKEWQEGGKQTLLLANSSGAYGGNYQRARYCIFLEGPLAPISRDQAERRVWRAGQTRPVVYYDVIARNGIDWKILQSVRAGRDLMRDVLEGSAV